MSDFWQRNVLYFGLLALVALVTGLSSGAANGFATLAAGLLIFLAYQLWQLRKLERWLAQPGSRWTPDAGGVWGEVFSRLYRLLRTQTQSQERLSTALDRLLQVTSAMPDGVLVLDEEDRIALCNRAAEEHLGIDPERDIGQQITFLVRDPRFVTYLSAGSPGEPLVLRLPRNLERALSLQLVPYGEARRLLISRDVTRLEQLETMRRDFIANVSHELRTPLTVVGGFLETLSDAEKPEPAMTRRALALMSDQTRRMQRLVEDLLTLSRLEDDHNLPREEEVDVPDLVRVLHQEAQSLSGGRHRIRVRIESRLWVRGAPDELRSAFGNLVSNAIRYTPEGGQITLAWEGVSGQVAFSVADTGIGIPAEHLPRLTERFYRVDRSRSRETGGTGLGLAIVKHVASRHQARMEVSSQPGKGSCFKVLFPAKRTVQPRARVVAEAG